jgi:hypothetical protein
LALVISGNILLYGFFGWLAYILVLINRYKNQIWQEFGRVNGWPVEPKVFEPDSLPPSLNYGHSFIFSPVLKAQLETVAADLFTFKCTTGEGKYSQDHFFTVATVALPAALPHLMLLSRSSHPDAHENIDNHTQLQLEGDFGKYFKLIVQSGQQIDVLRVLTPDVMQALIQYNQTEDIEINASRLYLILKNDKRDYKNLPPFLQSIVGLSSQITENIKLSTVATPVH